MIDASVIKKYPLYYKENALNASAGKEKFQLRCIQSAESADLTEVSLSPAFKVLISETESNIKCFVSFYGKQANVFDEISVGDRLCIVNI